MSREPKASLKFIGAIGYMDTHQFPSYMSRGLELRFVHMDRLEDRSIASLSPSSDDTVLLEQGRGPLTQVWDPRALVGDSSGCIQGVPPSVLTPENDEDTGEET